MPHALVGCSDSQPTHLDLTVLNAMLVLLGTAFIFALTLFVLCRMLPSAQKPYLRARKNRVLSDPAEMV
jgi:hypothetical protein